MDLKEIFTKDLRDKLRAAFEEPVRVLKPKDQVGVAVTINPSGTRKIRILRIR